MQSHLLLIVKLISSVILRNGVTRMVYIWSE